MKKKTFVQGRVFASSADEAAIKIRDMYKEYDGKLTIKEAFKILDWYEYFLKITEDESMQMVVTSPPYFNRRLSELRDVLGAPTTLGDDDNRTFEEQDERQCDHDD